MNLFTGEMAKVLMLDGGFMDLLFAFFISVFAFGFLAVIAYKLMDISIKRTMRFFRKLSV